MDTTTLDEPVVVSPDEPVVFEVSIPTGYAATTEPLPKVGFFEGIANWVSGLFGQNKTITPDTVPLVDTAAPTTIESVMSHPLNLYLIDKQTIPAGTSYRIISDGHPATDGLTIIQTVDPIEFINPCSHVDWQWHIGTAEDIEGCIAPYVVDAVVESVKDKAVKILSDLKPLTYDDKPAVMEALGEVYTKEERIGFFGQEVLTNG